jgi:hypothetical protein
MATAGRARVVSFVRCVSCVSSVSISTPKKEIFKTEIMFSRSRICSRNFKSHFLWLKNLLTQRGLVLTGANCKMHMSYGTRKKVEVFLTIALALGHFYSEFGVKMMNFFFYSLTRQ